MFKRARHQFGWLERKKRRRGPECGFGVTTRMLLARRVRSLLFWSAM